MHALSPRWDIVAALAIVAALCGVALRPSAVRAQASTLIATAAQHGHTRVIVTLDTAGAAEQVLAWLPASQQARQIGALPLLALDADALTLRALASDSRVRALSEDTLLAPADTSSSHADAHGDCACAANSVFASNAAVDVSGRSGKCTTPAAPAADVYTNERLAHLAAHYEATGDQQHGQHRILHPVFSQ